MKKKVLATSWHPRGANAISPVIRRLRAEERVNVVTIGHQHSESIFERNSIPHQKVGAYGVPDVSLESMRSVVGQENPDLLLTGTSGQDKDNKDVIEQTATLAAREKGIPSLAILDMWGNYPRRFSDIARENGKFCFLPDKLAVMDALAHDALVQDGVSPARLVITGNPYFDDLIELKKQFTLEKKARMRKNWGISDTAPVVLYASQPIEFHYGETLGYTEKSALRELLEESVPLSRRFGLAVLVKAHPRERKEALEQIAREYPLRTIVEQTSPVRDAILASDVVVSPFSTVLVESSYLDKPSLSLQPGLRGVDQLVTNSLGVTVPIYRMGLVGEVIQQALYDQSYIRHLARRRRPFRTDGKATERVTKLIYQMIGSPVFP